MGALDRLKHAWNAFTGVENSPLNVPWTELGPNYSLNPGRQRLRMASDRSIISSIVNRIGIDCSGMDMRHCRINDDRQYVDDIPSGLNTCLTVEANIDQGARAFRQDIVMSLLDKGVIAVVPVDTTLNPQQTGGYDIKTMRVGEIVAWYPRHVRINLFNEARGQREDVVLEKSMVAIIENPLYTVMNEPNSTLQRLLRKLSLLDIVDEQSSSGKLDLIIQLPYVIKSEARRQQADQRRKEIEFQLKGSQYGIAYTDGTEKITQLNRPAENNLQTQVEYLMKMLYGQLGITEDVMNGVADEAAMLVYYNRTVEPILQAIVEGMKRAFLTSTARSQNQSIEFFRDPFKLVPVTVIAEIADKFARNEVLSSNEIRAIVGFKPSKDPGANKLQNSNMPNALPPATQPAPSEPGPSTN